MKPWTLTGRALGSRNFRLYVAGQGTSLMGTWMTRVAMMWLVYRLTGSSVMLGVVAFAGQAPAFVLAPIAGVWLDRWNLRRTLVMTQVLSMVQSLALAVLTIADVITIPQVIALALFQGVIKAFGAGINEWRPAQWLTERGDFDLFLLAGRYTLLEQESLESFLPLCEKRGIGIVLGGPYNSGVLATGPVKGAFYNYDPAPKEILDEVARIEAVCKRHGVRLIEAALRFPLHHKSVVSIIPGGQSVAQVESNKAILSAKIPDALWADLKSDGLMRKDAPTP